MYYLLYPFAFVVSILPFWVLYGVSNAMYFIIFQIFGYRKSITKNNLTLSFPEKSEKEINEIMKKYYKNLCDSIVETFKLLTMSKAELNKRMTGNWEILLDDINSGKKVQAHLAHLFNWEWGTVAANWNLPVNFAGIYNRISSKAFNHLMYKIRTRSGSIMIDMDDMQKEMATIQKQKTLWAFVADQNPSEPRRGVWVDFFGRETSFFKGAELIARRYNNVVYFGRITKIKRGYYHLQLEKVFDQGNQTIDSEITKAYVSYLEKCIRLEPENWVWSHRRWKHSRS